MMRFPKSKNDDLIVQSVGNELLIFNLKSNQAFSLNETTKTIYQACDGKTSFAELNYKYNYSDDLIFLALDQLKKNDLIEDSYQTRFSAVSRRDVIRKIGFASIIALPVISAITVPTAALAGSNSCAPICVNEGQDYCVGCMGPTTATDYPVNSGCMGALITSYSHNCTGPAFVNPGFAVQRN